jgi:hypothetical protein
LLRGFEFFDSAETGRQRLRLIPNFAWFTGSFVMVPMPLPSKSTPAVRLHILLQKGMDMSQLNTKAMPLDHVCDLIGIATHCKRQAKYDLRLALALVGKHLANLLAAAR